MLNLFGLDFFLSTTKNKKIAKYLNQKEFIEWFNYLQALALSVFEWQNLPEKVDPFMVEWSLLNYGNVAFVELENYGVVSLPSAVGGKLNLYGYPTECYCWGFNGVNKKFIPYIPFTENYDECNGIVCYDNSLRFPYIQYVITYAAKISDTLRSITGVVRKMKTPYFIQCDPKQRQSIENDLKDINTNEDNIFIANNLNSDVFKVFDTKVNPALLTALWDNFDNTFDIWKDINGFNNNSQSDKKERVLEAEVNANNQTIQASVENRLKQRKQFAEFVNTKWGFGIAVDINKKAFEEFNDFEKEVDNFEDMGETGRFSLK